MELTVRCCQDREAMWAALAEDTQFPEGDRQVFGVLGALWGLSRYHMPQSREELVTWLLCEASLLRRRITRAKHSPARREHQRKQTKKLARRAADRRNRAKDPVPSPRSATDKSERSRLRLVS